MLFFTLVLSNYFLQISSVCNLRSQLLKLLSSNAIATKVKKRLSVIAAFGRSLQISGKALHLAASSLIAPSLRLNVCKENATTSEVFDAQRTNNFCERLSTSKVFASQLCSVLPTRLNDVRNHGFETTFSNEQEG